MVKARVPFGSRAFALLAAKPASAPVVNFLGLSTSPRHTCCRSQFPQSPEYKEEEGQKSSPTNEPVLGAPREHSVDDRISGIKRTLVIVQRALVRASVLLRRGRATSQLRDSRTGQHKAHLHEVIVGLLADALKRVTRTHGVAVMLVADHLTDRQVIRSARVHELSDADARWVLGCHRSSSQKKSGKRETGNMLVHLGVPPQRIKGPKWSSFNTVMTLPQKNPGVTGALH